MADLTKLTPPSELTEDDRQAIFYHIFRRLASRRNTFELWVVAEIANASEDDQATRKDFMRSVEQWAQELLRNAWITCLTSEKESDCPALTPLSDTSTADLQHLPPADQLSKILNGVLFLQVTRSRQYSSRTRAFLRSFAVLDEAAVAATLKDPDRAIEQAQKHASDVRDSQAERNKTWRQIGMGVGAVAGGVLIGVTGGLAAPLVGAGVSSVLGWLGVGGTAAGLLASGLAGSSAVCGALFGAYGARSTAIMVARHTRDIRDFALIPVKPLKDTLAVRLCISGWLSSADDVTAPWTIFEGDDTYALQWEVEALQALSTALGDLIKSHAMKYVRGEIIKRTVLATLMSGLVPLAWLKLGQIIDNPWMNARALALKAGKVLGTLLATRVFGNRPVSLVGFSLGSLVIYEALKQLASLPSSETLHLIEDVFLFGTPAKTDSAVWSAIRRLAGGRVVNGYASEDYVLAVLSRASDVSWDVAGLRTVDVMGVENVQCSEVDGHLKWRGMIGKCLKDCEAPDVVSEEVEKQVNNVAAKIEKEMNGDLLMSPEEEKKLMETEDVQQ